MANPIYQPRRNVRTNVRPSALNKGGGASLPALDLDAFMAGQTDGIFFDFTKTDRFFQEAQGPTLADDAGEVIGLALDQQLWSAQSLATVLAAQTNLTPAGSWSMSVGGGTSTAVESPAGTLTLQCDGVNSAQGDQSFATVVGRIYALTVTAASGTPNAIVGTSQGGTQNLGSTNISAGTTRTYYFTATATTTWVRLRRITSGTAVASGISVKLAPGNHAVQSVNTSFRPARQTSGCVYDGTDDNHLTAYKAAAGANFIVGLVTVPASIAATQIVTGAEDAASANRFALGFDTSGQVAAGVGSDPVATIHGSTDRRNTEVVVGLSFDGTTVRLFDDSLLAYEAVQNGSPSTATALRLGARNANGTAAAFFAGAVKKLVAGREFLTLDRYRQIRTALLSVALVWLLAGGVWNDGSVWNDSAVWVG